MSAVIVQGQAQANAALPAMRQDLNLFEAQAAEDGRPVWHLHDPAAHQFYRLGWPAFELLSRWSAGSVQALVEAVNGETTLEVEAEDVAGVIQFLERHHLLEARTSQDNARLLAYRNAQRGQWASWLLKNYLFFRLPLLRPEALLDRLAPHFSWFFRPLAWVGFGVAAVLALALAARQLEAFTHTFSAYANWIGALAFGIALTIAKLAHEMGHALTARHHGCRVPAMGIAFLVLWPVLYTDTNDAWKLSSRRARLQIALAGMAAESVLAIAATYLWIVLPESPFRAAAFFLATTTWVMTLAINASPFMRFDGYFLLSDALGLPNLHARSFAFGRWWLREQILDLGDPPPEEQRPGARRALIAFAFATWLYRFVLFLGIALLVYHFFFKALGLFLMLVEVAWFIVWPVALEFRVWWRRRRDLGWTRRTLRSAAVLVLLSLAALLPLQKEVTAPAVLASAREQAFFSPVPARVVEERAPGQDTVKAGEVLLRLAAPDLDYRLAIAAKVEAGWRRQLDRQDFSQRLQQQGTALRHYWEEAASRLAGLREEKERLTVRAPFDGTIMVRSEELAPGAWVTQRDLLYLVADRRENRLEAYVGEHDLDRLKTGARGRFLAEAPGLPRYECTVADIDRVNIAELEELMLGSVHGGAIAVRMDKHGALVPVNPVFRVRLDQCTPAHASMWRLRGTAHIEAEARSLAASMLGHVLRTLAREGGL